MKIAAYCRVSTDKEDQLNSLETQKQFFQEYAQRTGDTLVQLYADEGLSGTKIKNRKDFQRLMADAEKGLFEQIVVKDISRFARNTVDLLQNVRKLKTMGIEMRFLTANMTNMGNSEFVLTIFGALAQEESANTSKRIKFGKKVNMEKGRVPNIVYGYDKTVGDLFHLTINEQEATNIRQMFRWYVEDGLGTFRIAAALNQAGFRTKRGCEWSQNAVCRILTNVLYTGKIVNGKQEVADFLTSIRRDKNKSEWYIAERPELRIVDQNLFEKAQRIMAVRGQAFQADRSRHSGQHLFSTLIQCKDCGWSFRRVERKYKNTYIRWVCSGRSSRGAHSCPNTIAIDEEELIEVLQRYFAAVSANKKKIMDHMVRELTRTYNTADENADHEKALRSRLGKLEKTRQKYIDMYTDDLISREELHKKLRDTKTEIAQLEGNLKMAACSRSKSASLEALMQDAFKAMDTVHDLHGATNAQLRRLVSKIEVDQNGNVDIYLKILSDPDLGKTVPVCEVHT